MSLLAATECVRNFFNEPNTAIHKQITKFIEYQILTLVKKHKVFADHVNEFVAIQKSMKQPVKKIPAILPQELQNKVDQCWAKDEEVLDEELWTPESLCFVQYNVLTEFKIKNAVSNQQLG